MNLRGYEIGIIVGIWVFLVFLVIRVKHIERMVEQIVDDCKVEVR